MSQTGASRSAAPEVATRSPRQPVLLAAFGLLVIASLLGGLALRERRRALAQWEARLTAMADDRKQALDRWIADGVAEAGVAAAYPTGLYLASGRRGGPFPFPVEEGPQAHLAGLLTDLVAIHGYAAARLMGTDGRVLAQSRGSRPIGTTCLEAAEQTLRAGKELVGLHRHDDGSVAVSFTVPVRRTNGLDAAPDGAVVVEADASAWLYPLLARTAFPSRGAETVLVVRNGDRALFLNPLRQNPSPPLTFSRPLNDPGFAAAEALAGREGFGAFVDYRGVPILAATRRLESAPWGLIVKVDREEALAEVRRGLTLLGVAAVASYAAFLGAVRLLGQRQRSRYELALARREARTALALREANDVIFLVSPDGRIREAMGAAERLYGRSASELCALTAGDLRTPETRAEALANVQAVFAQGAGVFETIHQARDGRSFPVEVSCRRLCLEGEDVVVAIVRDVSERKAAEERIRFLNRVLRTLSEINQLMVHETDRERLLAEASRIAVEHGGFRMAWVGWVDREAGRVRPLAWAGAEEGYLTQIEIRIDEGPEGQGPAGVAVREGRTVAVDDIASSESFQPWREAALARGYRSVTACPIRVHGETVSAFVLYASRPSVFSGEVLPLIEKIASDLGFALESIEDRRRREEAEAALRTSEARFRLLAENAPDVVYRLRLRPEPGFEYVSPAADRITGYAVEELYSDPQSIFKLVHPEDRALLESLMRGEALGSPALLRWIRKDGSVIWGELRQVAVRDESGRIVALEGIARDVTEQRRREESLRQLSRAVEQSPASVLITDTTGAIEYANPKFSAVSGYDLPEVLGRNPRMLKSGRVPPETYAELWRTITTGGEWSGELCNRRKSGELYWESVSISPIVGEGGRITHFVAVKEDITDRKRAGAALAQAREELYQAQKMEAVGRLAGAVAHDFNNLLNVITGYGELLARSMHDGGSARGRVDQILKAAGRAAALTRQLLAFSRRQVMSPKVVDLNEVVRDIEKMLRRIIGEDVELVVRLAPSLGSVRVDPGQIEQVIMNLVVNARDAMPRGGVLGLETADADLDAAYALIHEPVAPGPYVMLAVSDTGVGMDEATRARIFEPFFTTKPPGQGTGLGLSTVYGIVKQSGGYIWVYSEPGRGTTFKVYLPRVDEAPERPGAPSREAPSAAGKETILLVEDQAALREMMREALESLGYAVLEAEAGEQALEIARSHPGRIDLLVTDVVMPRMSGRAVAEALASRRPETRVLYCSGYTSEMIARQGLLEAGLFLLEKPFALDALARKVREALEAPPPGRR